MTSSNLTVSQNYLSKIVSASDSTHAAIKRFNPDQMRDAMRMVKLSSDRDEYLIATKQPYFAEGKYTEALICRYQNLDVRVFDNLKTKDAREALQHMCDTATRDSIIIRKSRKEFIEKKVKALLDDPTIVNIAGFKGTFKQQLEHPANEFNVKCYHANYLQGISLLGYMDIRRATLAPDGKSIMYVTIDWKTTSLPLSKVNQLKRNSNKYGYISQLAMYALLVQLEGKQASSKGYLLFIGNKRKYDTNYENVTSLVLEYDLVKPLQDLKAVLDCIAKAKKRQDIEDVLNE